MMLISAASTSAQETVVSTVSELRDAVAAANNNGGNTTILVADGTYKLSTGLYINAPDITIAGQSGDREKVVIEGDAMSSTANVGTVITVAADDFTLQDVTLQKSRYHLIQIKGESDADSPTLRNCILRDAYEQIVKVSVNLSDTSVSSDHGVIENCIFEYSAGIGPQYYIGGIDAHGSKNWTVRGNTFKNIISPGNSIAQYAIHFWNDSADNVVDGNLVIDCDRGIGFGLGSRGNSGGLIVNNMIYHSGRGDFADVGISIQNSPNSDIYNNTVFLSHSYPQAIEYRFSGTSGARIINNLTNRPIRSLDGANGVDASNNVNAESSWFLDAGRGDLHLGDSISEVVDAGQDLTAVVYDYDGDRRPFGPLTDIGADELTDIKRPRPPSDLVTN